MVRRERLHAGGFVAEVVPEIGGSLAAFYTLAGPDTGRHDWLRPATASALAERSPLGMASFPLVPWCNRIRGGRFVWNDRTVQLAPNYGASPHAIHGLGWQRPWTIAGRGESWLELAYTELGDGAWPFRFEATQRYEVDSTGLSISLALHNTGSEPMPAGIGHHPYFPHPRDSSGTQVRATVQGIWLSDEEVMPTALAFHHPAVAALNAGMSIAEHVLDNNFVGFGHAATIRWPDGSALRLVGEPPLDFLVLYSPARDDFFCLEAVSNCTDWINLVGRPGEGGAAAADVGGMALEPGRVLRAQTRFLPVAREPAT